MTHVESIYQIKSAALDFQIYLNSKDAGVSYRAQMQYEQWVNRFFRENVNMVEPEKHNICLDGFDFFQNCWNQL